MTDDLQVTLIHLARNNHRQLIQTILQDNPTITLDSIRNDKQFTCE